MKSSVVDKLTPCGSVMSWCSLRRIASAGYTLIALLLALPHAVSGESTAPSTRRTLHRSYDAVAVRIDSHLVHVLSGNGEPLLISRLALCRSENNTLVEIPFQINGYDHGIPVLDNINANVEKRNGSYSKKSDLIRFVPTTKSGMFSEGDELVFIIKDTGERYTRGDLPQGYRRGVELCIADPVDNGKAWAYLVTVDKSPLNPTGNRPLDDYIQYSLEERKDKKGKATSQLEHIVARNFFSLFDISKSAANKEFGVTRDGGGSDENFVIEFRSTAALKLRGIPFTVYLNPEKNVFPHMIGYIDGPVEAQRVVYNKVKLPLLGEQEDLSLLTVSHYYPGYFYFNGRAKLPGWVKKFIKEIDSVMTTDFNRNAIGMTWYNSNNTEGVKVDGIMDEKEQTLNGGAYKWSLIVGDKGGWANILNMKTETMKDKMKLYYEDNKDFKPQGIYGSTGYRITEILDVSEIVFDTYIFSVPRTFTPKDMDQLMDLVYHPAPPADRDRRSPV